MYHRLQLVGVLILFFGVMCYVTCIAYTRSSGKTSLDMATIQKLRYEAFTKQSNSS